jgi:hypothetical protein
LPDRILASFSNVSLYSAAAVLGDATGGTTCDRLRFVPTGCATCPATQHFFSITPGARTGDAFRTVGFFVTAAGAERAVVQAGGTLALLGLDAPARAFSPTTAVGRIDLDAAGQATFTAATAGAISTAPPAVPLRLLFAPAKGDRVAFTWLDSSARIFSVDLGDDGTAPVSREVLGLPVSPPNTMNAPTWTGPVLVDGRRLLLRSTTATAGTTLELWELTLTTARLLGSTGLTLPVQRLAIEPLGAGAFLVLELGTTTPGYRVLSLGAWARAEAFERPLLDGPLAGGAMTCTSSSCLHLGGAWVFGDAQRLHFVGYPIAAADNATHAAYTCDP